MKVLIWNNFKLLERRGGPPTYLFNLKKAVLETGNEEVSFLDLYGADGDSEKRVPLMKRIRKKAAQFIYQGKANHRLRFGLFLRIFPKTNPELPDIDYDAYDFIHFHSTLDLYQYRRIRTRFKGKILLTSHCPKPPHIELIEDVFHLHPQKISRRHLETLKAIDDFALQTADYLMFPAASAMEPYRNQWEGFSEIADRKRTVFVPTGIPPAKYSSSRQAFRANWNIPEDAIVFSFIGRHNEVKGYDLLRSAGAAILDRFPQVYFTLAGLESPLQGLRHDRWIEIGWTSDPHSLVNASDCFVLPNRETFFDLVLLEVLSLNQKCILSYTGGNKFFQQFSHPDLFFFEETSSACLEEAMATFLQKKTALRQSTTRELFDKEFTHTQFLYRYVAALRELCPPNAQSGK